ncbi:MAG: hypothetical protein GEU87_12905 [Alphaproteobacteria bacterium]|nr:hypothetical protein [Alphaproteobacteria bacterium]
MAKLEELRAGSFIKGLAPSGAAKVVHIEWFGDQAVKATYEESSGAVRNRLVFRNEEPTLELVSSGRPWSFNGDGALLRLVSEAYRIQLAHLFDPYLAIHTSRIEPLPHQITAVYGEMLPRQPLRFLLADDPGAGKTIMAGLFIKELMIRGDVERCLIVAPGSLVEQWQDELHEKFGLSFDILSRDQVEASRTANPFVERNLLIARLDVLSRNPDLQEKLRAAPEWDLIVCDEAHRMSASFFGGEVKYTKRYQLGQALGGHCRHLLLMTATPHNGKEQDFQLFMALLDADRFEGRFRDGVHQAEVADLMRRLTKEELLKFDGTPLFPERRAYTVKYELSPAEVGLYADVTTYVREEMNRADRFAAEGDEKRRQNVGFALTILQRRLASSPAAIHESLRRRRERLEGRLAEERLLKRGQEARLATEPLLPAWSEDDEAEIEDAPGDEAEAAEEAILDQATASRTIAELETEIETLRRLEAQAAALRRSGTDTKWMQLNSILDDPLMVDSNGNHRKLIVFTEPRDTLTYLADRIRTRLGRHDAVVVIHGGVGREDRRKAVEAFVHDKEVLVLVANDAAGEGINLQRAHLMVNYDLPWNPNRLEQRFGRIHRIGQTEVCHCWNLVAADTREGEVFSRLLEKIEIARAALGGRVYDVLGRLFEARALRELLIEAIRDGERPETKARLFQKVDAAADQQHLLDLLADRALVRDTMTAADVARIREEMDRAEARRLQPFHIQAFFLEAFQHLGGRVNRREAGRWEITRVPGPIRDRDRLIGTGAPIQPRYERICFEKDKINQPPVAAFVCPGQGQDPLAVRASKKLVQEEALLVKMGPARLKLVLDTHLWADANHIGTKKLAEYLASYLYLPRLRDGGVLHDAIQAGISELVCDNFAYAGRFDEEKGRYEGLKLTGGGSVVVDSLSVLVKPEIAKAQQAADAPTAPGRPEPGPVSPGSPTGSSTGTPAGGGGFTAPTPKAARRFFGTVEIDADRAGRGHGPDCRGGPPTPHHPSRRLRSRHSRDRGRHSRRRSRRRAENGDGELPDAEVQVAGVRGELTAGVTTAAAL